MSHALEMNYFVTNYFITCQGDIIFMTICLFVCLVTGLHKYYWSDLTKNEQMSLGPN